MGTVKKLVASKAQWSSKNFFSPFKYNIFPKFVLHIQTNIFLVLILPVVSQELPIAVSSKCSRIFSGVPAITEYLQNSKSVK